MSIFSRLAGCLPKTKVPWHVKWAWGLGGWADNYTFSIVNLLFLYLYVDYFKLDPVLAGVALCIPRIFDAVTDPLMGNWSDNFRSRWGRRRPLIVFGAIGCAVLLPLYWMPPLMSTVHNPWYCNGPFLYISILGCVYAAAYTLFVVPFTALGYEITSDYHEITKVMSWRMYFGLIGQSLSPLAYTLSVNKKFFPNIQQGAIVMSMIAGVFIMVLGIIPALVCKENPEHSKREKTPFFQALRGILSNKPYRMQVAGFFVVLVFLTAPQSVGGLLNLYYTCGGNETLNGSITYWGGTLTALISIVSILFLTFISHFADKKGAFICGMGMATIAYVSYWFTMRPEHPYMQLYSLALLSLSMQGCWLMLDSMCADACDYEEYRSGRRSEGIISSFRGFIQKMSNALCSLLGGIMLKACGFDAELAHSAAGLPESVLLKMKAIFVILPPIGLMAVMILFFFYPLTKERCAEVRAELKRRSASTADPAGGALEQRG